MAKGRESQRKLGEAKTTFQLEMSDARVRAAYGSAYDRLVALKRRWDPSNLFRMNQNVVP